MRHTAKLLASSSVMMLIAGAAMADPSDTSIPNLPDNSVVTLSGTVDKVENEHLFMLRNDKGLIEVRVPADQPLVLKESENVTVTGTVEKPLWGLLGSNIEATSVHVQTSLPTAISNAVTAATGITMDRAENVRIGKLPAQGMVQISGVVDKVSDSKNFVVKDTTGAVPVSIQSDENVVVAKGVEVTVTGYVNNGLLGKKIRATHVIMMSNAPADTGHMSARVN